jgi:hypothetical protein
MRVDFNQKFARPGVPHKHMPEPKPVNDKLLLRHMQRSVYVSCGDCGMLHCPCMQGALPPEVCICLVA